LGVTVTQDFAVRHVTSRSVHLALIRWMDLEMKQAGNVQVEETVSTRMERAAVSVGFTEHDANTRRRCFKINFRLSFYVLFVSIV